MSNLAPIGSSLSSNFLDSPDPSSLPSLFPNPPIAPVFANLRALDPRGEDLSSYQQAFAQLNNITAEKMLERIKPEDSYEQQLSYCHKIFDENIDMYSTVLPLRFSLATYSEGSISGNYMPDQSIAMCGITEANAPRVAQFIFEHEIPIIVRLTAHIQEGIEKSLDWIKNSPIGKLSCKIEKSTTINILGDKGLIIATLEETHFTLSENDKEHKVIEIYLKDWPDGDVVSPEAVIAAVRVLRGELAVLKHNTKKIPYIVHCSAGIGRTGVFLTIKKTMEDLENFCDPYIPDIILDLRLARNEHMVMNEEQFKLCYDAKKYYQTQIKRPDEPPQGMKV